MKHNRQGVFAKVASDIILKDPMWRCAPAPTITVQYLDPDLPNHFELAVQRIENKVLKGLENIFTCSSSACGNNFEKSPAMICTYSNDCTGYPWTDAFQINEASVQLLSFQLRSGPLNRQALLRFNWTAVNAQIQRTLVKSLWTGGTKDRKQSVEGFREHLHLLPLLPVATTLKNPQRWSAPIPMIAPAIPGPMPSR